MKKIYSLALMAFMGAAVANAQKAFKLDKNYVITTCVQVADGQKVDDEHKGNEVTNDDLKKIQEAYLDEDFTTFPIVSNTSSANYHVMNKDYTDPETGFTLQAGTYATIKGNDIAFYDSENKQGLSNIKKVIIYLASQGRSKVVASLEDESGNRLNYQSEDTNNREIRQYYAPVFAAVTDDWTVMSFDQPLRQVIDLTNAQGTTEEMTGSGQKMTSGDDVKEVIMLYQFPEKATDPSDGHEIAGDKMIEWTADNAYKIQFKQAAYIMGIAFVCGDDTKDAATFDISSDTNWNGTETGISSVVAEGAAKSNEMYNLAGQRIAAPVSGQIYIQNGKKYIAK